MFNWTGNKTSNNSSQHFKCRKKHKLSSLGLVQWLTKEKIKNQNKQTIYTHHSLSWYWNTGLETCQWSGYCLTIHGIRPWILGAWLSACRSQTGTHWGFALTGSATVWQVLCKIRTTRSKHTPLDCCRSEGWGRGRGQALNMDTPLTRGAGHISSTVTCPVLAPCCVRHRPRASVCVRLRPAASDTLLTRGSCNQRRVMRGLAKCERAGARDLHRKGNNGLLQQCRRHEIHRQAIRLRW